MRKKSTQVKEPTLGRRQFLVGAGAGVAAAGAALVLSKESASVHSAGTQEQADAQGKGYQLTEHVKSYYKTLLV
ncbi:twin-arginine translocation signal domain-containing protein [Limnobacter humi]|uniref:Twin-arginine translocation signal domain-containing protein n=1 Tax=Limnobacter humi TaxID=1778671 RepID=A0ABT1WEF8_9BURK|nr:twin-arginine translocation signal domain-containing protein [Limnobacter humi]MCQ8895907.1 twin-arginine translocation signal domain-containing protein [Limnobacter humi]